MSTLKLVGQLRPGGKMIHGNTTAMVLEIYGEHLAELEALAGKSLTIALSDKKPKRSINANNLCWELCTQIGKAMTPPVPKEDIYRSAIRDVGEYTQLMIQEDAFEAFQEAWSAKGTGWFAEHIDDAPLRGYILIFAYSGSSTYDTRAMSKLIDYLVDQAEQMELPIAYDLLDINRIKEAWARERDL